VYEQNCNAPFPKRIENFKKQILQILICIYIQRLGLDLDPNLEKWSY
jgi:hypothetical protein